MSSPSNTPSTDRKSDRKSTLVWWIFMLLTIPFTVACISSVSTIGKLQHDPVWDDVAYYTSGYTLYSSWMRDGAPGVIKTYVETKPKAVFNPFAAAVSFVIFGPQDWAPMALDLIVVMSLMGLALWMVRDCPWWTQAAAGIYVLSSPLALACVVEFRPDYYAGILLCAAPTYLFFVNNSYPRKRDFLVAGLLIGLSFLVKCTIFPLIGVIAAGTLAGGLMLRLTILDKEARYRDVTKIVALYVFSALLIALPQLLTYGSQMVSYFYEVAMKKDSIWYVQGTLAERLSYYIYGPGATYLNTHLAISYTGLVAALVVGLWLMPRPVRFACAAWFVMYLGIYAVLTKAAVKSQWIGVLVIVYVFLAPMLALYFVNLIRDKRLRIGGSIVLSVLIAASFFFINFSRSLEKDFYAMNSRRQKEINRQVLSIISQDSPMEAGKRTVRFASTGTFLNRSTYEWISSRIGLPYEFSGFDTSDSLDTVKTLSAQNDYTVVAEPYSQNIYSWFPTNQHAAELIKYLDASPQAKYLGGVPSLNGPLIRVYRNETRVPMHYFSGWSSVTGVEYQQNSPHLFGSGKVIEFRLTNEPVDNAAFYIRAYSQSPGEQEMTITLDGRAIATQKIAGAGAEVKATFPLGSIKGGESLRIEFSESKQAITADSKFTAIILDEARILKDGAKP